MTQQELEVKVKKLKTEWESKLGPLTDIWLHHDLMAILDQRPWMEQVLDPLKIDETYVTGFPTPARNRVRIAFLAEIELNETDGVDRPTPGGE